MDLGPHALLAINPHRAGRHLQELAGLGGGVRRVDLVLRDLREQLALHLLVVAHRLRRQVNVDRHDHRLLEVEVVLGAERDADVAHAILYLLLRERQWRELTRERVVAYLGPLEPAALEARICAPKALASILEPHLRPQVLQAVWCRRTGQIDPPSHILRLCDARQLARPLAAPGAHNLVAALADLHAQAHRLQARRLVTDDVLERPAAAQSREVLEQPWDVLVVYRVRVRAFAERGLALLRRADHWYDAEVSQMPPLPHFGRPRAERDALRREDDRRPFVRVTLQQLQEREHGDGLPESHRHP